VHDVHRPQRLPETGGASDVELAVDGEDGRGNSAPLELGADGGGSADDVDVDPLGRDGRSEIAEVRDRPAARQSRHVEDPQTDWSAGRSRRDHSAAARPPSNQNGAEYWAEMKLPETAATTSAAAIADA